MEYAFNLNNFRQLIDSDIIPDNDENGFTLDIEIAKVTIRKPYIDTDGDKRGNSIFICTQEGCQIYINFIRHRRIEYLVVVYKEEGTDLFIPLNNQSPLPIRKLFNTIWIGIIDAIKVHELVYADIRKKELELFNDPGNESVTLEKFIKQFRDYIPPKSLIKLFEFQYSEDCLGYYSATLLLDVIDNRRLKRYSAETSFLRSFIEFAQADLLGGTYGFWLIENREISECPVVYFSEGREINIIAKNIIELLRMASYNAEPVICKGSVSFINKEKVENRQNFYTLEYKKWIKKELGLEPVCSLKEIEQMIEKTQIQYKEKFVYFLKKYNI